MVINNNRAGRLFVIRIPGVNDFPIVEVFITDQFKRGRKGDEWGLLRSGSVILADQDLNGEIRG
jgi:hypothetical protein